MQKIANAVGVLAKTFEILSCFRRKPQGLTLGEISEFAQINKSTAHRLLSQMVARGFIERTDDRRYIIGYALFQIGLLAPKPQELRSAVHPIMTELARETGETINLALLDGSEILAIHVIESPHEFRMAAKIGSRKPFHLTALGKSAAAFLPEAKLEFLLEHIRLPLEAPTPNSIADLARLREELNLTRSRGYGLDFEECVLGVRAVASPVFSDNGEVEGALSISGPTSRLSTERIPALAVSVINAANTITTRLGGHPRMIQSLSQQNSERAGQFGERLTREHSPLP
jgi:IclR family KDG regulon transcriptional repressor